MTDPTLQQSGPMTVFTQQYVNANAKPQISSFPLDAPPLPWTEGNQWINLLPNGGTIPSQYQYSSTMAFIKVADRSNQSIPVNKGYSFLCLGYGYIANSCPYFELWGTEGGSTCLPGIALYNLASNPKAWTIIKPQNFTGSFSVSWLNPGYVIPVTATIVYAPAQDGFPTSRLSFVADGLLQYFPSDNTNRELMKGPSIFLSASEPHNMDKRPVSEGVEPEG
jgi:hypothetical protein